MYMTYEETTSPIKACKPMTREVIRNFQDIPRSNKFHIETTLFEALFLPGESSNYTVEICIQENRMMFPQKKAHKRNIKYGTEEGIRKTVTILSASRDPKDLSDIFIYLKYDGKNISFPRISPETFLNKRDTIVVKLIPDPSIGKVEEYVYSGLIKLKLCLIDTANPMLEIQGDSKGDDDEEEEEESEEEDFGLEDEFTKLDKKIEKRKNANLRLKPYCIIANVHMSRHLVAGDCDGTSDPYVVMTVDAASRKTQVKYDTVNAVWHERLIFENVLLDAEDKETWPVVFMKVMDAEKVLSDEMLGFSFIWLSEASHEISRDKVNVLDPIWHQLHLAKSNKPQGQILCSFHIVDMENTNLINKARQTSIVPESTWYTFEINILGLRDLKPMSILPIKKSFISMDLNSINLSGQSDSNMRKIKTQPSSQALIPQLTQLLNSTFNFL